MGFHSNVPLLTACVSIALGCGSAEPLSSPTPTAKPSTHRATSGKAVISSRVAPVPNASARDRIVFLRAGSVWMMGPDGEAPEQLTVRSLEAADALK